MIWLFSLLGLLVGLAVASGIWWRWSQPVPANIGPAPVPFTAAPPAKLPATEYHGEDFQRLNARVTSIKFFASEGDFLRYPPKNERVYSQHFLKSQAKYLNWQLDLAHPANSDTVSFNVESTWYGPKGNVIDTVSTKLTVPAGWGNSFHARGLRVTDRWEPGTYRVVLSIEGKVVANATFQLADSALAPIAPQTVVPPVSPSTTPGVIVSWKDGKFIIAPGTNTWKVVINQDTILPDDMDASVSLTFQKAEDPTYGSGLVFWAKDYNDYYVLSLTPGGDFGVQRVYQQALVGTRFLAENRERQER